MNSISVPGAWHHLKQSVTAILQNMTQKFIRYLLSIFELQLVISLLSLPILISWGIPTSIMAPLAHLLFTPILVMFLWCSCITTMLLLLNMPTTYPEYLMLKITDVWLYLLSLGKPTWILGFPTSMLPVSAACCLIIFITYSYLKPPQHKSLMLLTLLWCSMLLMRPYFMKIPELVQIGSLPLWAIQIHKKIYLIDHGALCTRKNLYNNLDYTVLPELIKTTGHHNFDGIVLCKPSNKMVRVAQQCAMQCNCRTFIVTTKAQNFERMQHHFTGSYVRVLPLNSAKRAPSVQKNRQKK